MTSQTVNVCRGLRRSAGCETGREGRRKGRKRGGGWPRTRGPAGCRRSGSASRTRSAARPARRRWSWGHGRTGPAETAMPTWEAPGATVLKNTRSPGASASGDRLALRRTAPTRSAAARGPAGRTRRPRNRCSRTRRGRCRRSGKARPAATGRSRRRVARGSPAQQRTARRLGGGRGAAAGGAGRRKGRRHGAGRCAAVRPAGSAARSSDREAHDGRLIGGDEAEDRLRGRCAPFRVRRRRRLLEELPHLEIVRRVEDRLRRRLHAARPGRPDRSASRPPACSAGETTGNSGTSSPTTPPNRASSVLKSCWRKS